MSNTFMDFFNRSVVCFIAHTSLFQKSRQGPTMDRVKECIESRIVIRLVNGVTPDMGAYRGSVSLRLGWLSLLDLNWLDNLNLYTLIVASNCHSSIFSNKSLVSDMIHVLIHLNLRINH